MTKITISHIRREIYKDILWRTLWEHVEATNRTKLIWIVSHFSCGAKLLSWRYEQEKRKVEHCRTIVEEQWRCIVSQLSLSAEKQTCLSKHWRSMWLRVCVCITTFAKILALARSEEWYSSFANVKNSVINMNHKNKKYKKLLFAVITKNLYKILIKFCS